MNQRIFGLVTVGYVVFGLVGCAWVNESALALFATGSSAAAVVEGQRLQGVMKLFPNHTGTLTLRALEKNGNAAGPLTSCVGRLRYSGSTTGALDMRCSGGVVAEISMTLLGDTRGYGYGHTAHGIVSVAFGFTEAQNQAYLLADGVR